jgi:hypothetical protein
MIDLTDHERLAPAVELRRITDDDHSPGSFRTRALKEILDKAGVTALQRPPLPPPKRMPCRKQGRPISVAADETVSVPSAPASS